jgi:hypothetical protein
MCAKLSYKLAKKLYIASHYLSANPCLKPVMNYPIPASPQEIAALRQKSVDEELIASAIVGVIRMARSQGQSLQELTAEVLADDALLDSQQRHRLSEIVAQVWDRMP